MEGKTDAQNWLLVSAQVPWHLQTCIGTLTETCVHVHTHRGKEGKKEGWREGRKGKEKQKERGVEFFKEEYIYLCILA